MISQTLRTLILITAASAAAFRGIAGEPGRYGVVEFSACYMREEPGYTKELGNQALMGTVVTLGDREGYWRQITTPDPYTAWVDEMSVVEMTEDAVNEYIAAPKYIVLEGISRIFSKASKNSSSLSDLVSGDLLRIALDGKGKPVRKGSFLKVILPSGKEGWVLRRVVAEFGKWAREVKASPERIVAEAKKSVGVPYLWGGNTAKGADCSGLVKGAFFACGLLVPRNTGQQIKLGEAIDASGIFEGDFSSLREGDLVFFGDKETMRPSHVAIYCGDGHIVHSSMIVRVNSLRPADDDYYAGGLDRLIAVRRLLSPSGDGSFVPAGGVIPISLSPFYFPSVNIK